MFPFIIAGIVVLFLLFIVSYFHPLPTQSIDGNIFAVRCGNVNFFAYKTSNNVILFDCGMNKISIENGLQQFNISPDQVTHIFLTHSDPDHMNGLYLFNKANIYISVLEEPLINGETPRRLFLHNKKLTKYATMKNKETMNVDGNEIKIIETPGHTIGSACYLINNRYLISGDLLYLTRNKKIKPFLFLNNMDHKKLKESLDTMKNIIENVDYLLTSHSGMYKK